MRSRIQVYSDPATVTVTASHEEVRPIANAGKNENVATGTTVQLDGSASSDSLDRALTYTWTLVSKPATSAAGLQRSTSVDPVLVPDVDGEYVVKLVVSNGTLESEPDQITIIAATENSIPVADAGDDQEVIVGDSVMLDGSGSHDADGDKLTYRWMLTKQPEESVTFLSEENTVSPTLAPDMAGDYVVTLVVNDGISDSEPTTVVVSAVKPSIKLFSAPDSFFDDTEKYLPWPYSVNSVKSYRCVGSCGAQHIVQTFKLVAKGGNFTIVDLIASNLNTTSDINPSFEGLHDGMQITSGNEVEFNLVSDWTKEEIVNLTYRFRIEETGDTFNYRIQLQTN